MLLECNEAQVCVVLMTQDNVWVKWSNILH
jgi:hypothetical protein